MSSVRTPTYEPYVIRRHEHPLQKERLCLKAINEIAQDFGLDANFERLSFVLGPGSTAAMFLENFIDADHARHGLRVVSSNLDLISVFSDHYREGRFWELSLFGDRVDFKNRSLLPASDEALRPLLEREEVQFGVMSCASVRRDATEGTVCFGAYTAAHSSFLRQVVEASLDRVYLLADDSKRQVSLAAAQPHVFLTVDGDQAEGITLIVEAAADPVSLRTSDEVGSGVEQWMLKDEVRCFISYGSMYSGLAEHLYMDLSEEGIRCWKWDINGKRGAVLWQEIRAALESESPVVLICGEESLKSEPVKRELSEALHQRRGDSESPIVTMIVDEYLYDGWNPASEDTELAIMLRNSVSVRHLKFGSGGEEESEDYRRAVSEIDSTLRRLWYRR